MYSNFSFVWNPWATPKVNIFMWWACIGRLATQKELSKRADSWNGDVKVKKVLRTVLCHFFWRIWFARNDKIFKGKATTTRSIVKGIKQDVFLWLSTRINVSRDVWRNWCRFPLGE
ncbi:hypothetical protein Hdeb2414_s0010g00345591 [Helianthus debilis subsp. tardiflorus]